MFPLWLHALSIAALLFGFVCLLWLLADVIRHPQHMAIMNVVWPVTALFGGVVIVWAYFRFGRLKTHDAKTREERHGKAETPFPVAVGKGALHCGSGCTIGDILAEWLAYLAPAVAAWFGWHWLFAEKMFAVWVLDFIFAFLLGIVFQYFAIAPMRNLSPGKGIYAALKADSLSLTAWQLGMYGFMAFAQFYLFRRLLGVTAEVNTPEFWFAMQFAMIAGFITSYPVNWWLIRAGIKERM